MKRLLILLIVHLRIVFSATELFHSSFETPSLGGAYGAFFPLSVIDGWTVSDGSVEIVGTFWSAAEGNQSVDLSGVGDQAGTITREVATVPHASYLLRFALTANPGDGATIKESKVFWNNQEVTNLTVNTDGLSFTNMGWKYYSLTLQATSQVSRISFQSLTRTPFGPVIDDISLVGEAPPPPPASLTANLYAGVLVEGVAGVRQQLQFTTDPTQTVGWQTLGILTIPPDGKFFYLDPTPATGKHRYYRTLSAD